MLSVAFLLILHLLSICCTFSFVYSHFFRLRGHLDFTWRLLQFSPSYSCFRSRSLSRLLPFHPSPFLSLSFPHLSPSLALFPPSLSLSLLFYIPSLLCLLTFLPVPAVPLFPLAPSVSSPYSHQLVPFSSILVLISPATESRGPRMACKGVARPYTYTLSLEFRLSGLRHWMCRAR